MGTITLVVSIVALAVAVTALVFAIRRYRG
jgi:hypothetical protein